MAKRTDSMWQKLSSELSEIIEQAQRFIVTIEARPRIQSSGILWKQGLIVTANHTIRREENIRIGLPDANTAGARLVARDRLSDVAILKLTENVDVEYHVVAPAEAKAGQVSVALGRSQYGTKAALAMISGIRGPVRLWHARQIESVILVDLRLFPGFSGSALLDSTGGVLGVNTSGLLRNTAAALPARIIESMVDEVLRKGHISRAYLGLAMMPVALPEGNNGLIVLRVEPESPAARAGLIVGDVVLSFAGTSLNTIEDVQALLSHHKIGETISADILRGGKRTEAPVTIGEKSA